MSFYDLGRSVCIRFAAEWAEKTPVQYPNEFMDSPSSEEDFHEPRDAWVRLSILNGPGFNNAVSGISPGRGTSVCVRDTGIITVQIFTQPGEGAGNALRLADEIVPIFENRYFNGVDCRASSVIPLGTIDEWYQVNVTTTFIRDRK